MKRLLAAALASAMMLSLAACGEVSRSTDISRLRSAILPLAHRRLPHTSGSRKHVSAGQERVFKRLRDGRSYRVALHRAVLERG